MNKDELNELLMLLPSNIRNNKDFTFKTKLVLAQLVLMNGLDKAKKDGYFFVTNQKLVDELAISEPTLIKTLRQLEAHGYIKRKQGKRGEASEYIVNEELIYGNTKNLSNNLSKDLSNNLSKKIDDLTLIINDLVKTNQMLITKIEHLETLVKQNKNFSTDTESDTEIELDINNNIKYNNIISRKNINKNNTRINIKEKELNEDIFKKMKEASSSIDDAPIKRKSKNYTMIIDIDDNPILDEYIMSRAEECKKII